MRTLPVPRCDCRGLTVVALCVPPATSPSEAHEAKAQICCRDSPCWEVATRQIHAALGQFRLLRHPQAPAPSFTLMPGLVLLLDFRLCLIRSPPFRSAEDHGRRAPTVRAGRGALHSRVLPPCADEAEKCVRPLGARSDLRARGGAANRSRRSRPQQFLLDTAPATSIPGCVHSVHGAWLDRTKACDWEACIDASRSGREPRGDADLFESV